MNKNDIPAVAKVERLAWGDEAASVEQITQRLATFSAGSIVAINQQEQIVGYAAAQLVNQISTSSWAKQTGDGTIANTHKANGQFVYGVSMSGIQNGVSTAVIEYYYNIFISSGQCNFLCLGSRLPGFQKWYNETGGDIKTYLRKQKKGFHRDPELKLYQKLGFEFMWEMPEYFPDPKSLNWGAFIIMR